VSADEEAPLPGWEQLGARDAMRVLRGQPRRLLEQLHTFEDRHRRRTSVLAAIRRAIDRVGRCDPA
jgi:hypothetical protein